MTNRNALLGRVSSFILSLFILQGCADISGAAYCPEPDTDPDTDIEVVAPVKRIWRINDRLSYFDAVIACAEERGSLVLPESVQEHITIGEVCGDHGADPTAECWQARTTPEAAMDRYTHPNPDRAFIYPVCQSFVAAPEL